jgi:hypothetical protein
MSSDSYEQMTPEQIKYELEELRDELKLAIMYCGAKLGGRVSDCVMDFLLYLELAVEEPTYNDFNCCEDDDCPACK